MDIAVTDVGPWATRGVRPGELGSAEHGRRPEIVLGAPTIRVFGFGREAFPPTRAKYIPRTANTWILSVGSLFRHRHPVTGGIRWSKLIESSTPLIVRSCEIARSLYCELIVDTFINRRMVHGKKTSVEAL
ncbi:hypothetical protein TIFTF001_033425 [Ficus carica]|uniref:Uncharacterized protein n=1 Tax=Ficus carica TaxID=3494 RepID=A0AA88J7U8_FICCA|nr:hypothetical protein TIFTF001_033425 [Ficus carica]